MLLSFVYLLSRRDDIGKFIAWNVSVGVDEISWWLSHGISCSRILNFYGVGMEIKASFREILSYLYNQFMGIDSNIMNE